MRGVPISGGTEGTGKSVFIAEFSRLLPGIGRMRRAEMGALNSLWVDMAGDMRGRFIKKVRLKFP